MRHPLIGLYAGPVLLATQVAAAALFNPLRHRVQRLVDQRFNRARYDADQTVAAFAARLHDAVDPEGPRIRPRLGLGEPRQLRPPYPRWL